MRIAGLLSTLLLFVLAPLRGAETIHYLIYSFQNGTDGEAPYPQAGLIQPSDGNLWGTTYQGGAGTQGTLFKISPSTGVLSTLANFSGPNGSSPEGGLLLTATGNIFGTTSYGGANNGAGTIFSADPATGAVTKQFDFAYTNGAWPLADLVQTTAGEYYGTTVVGGANGKGTVYRYDPAGRTVTTLFSFTGGSDGSFPACKLWQATDGKLYGVTQQGGNESDGTLFRFDPVTKVLTTMITFNGANGAEPYAGVMQARDGYIYGTCQYGGAGTADAGTVFRFDPATGALVTMISFDLVSTGAYPAARIIQAADGNLYGSTYGGGYYGLGTIFRLNPLTGAITTLVAFNNFNGSLPSSALIQGVDGKLYGTTQTGGSGQTGTVFALIPGDGGSTPSIYLAYAAYAYGLAGDAFSSGQQGLGYGAIAYYFYYYYLDDLSHFPNAANTSVNLRQYYNNLAIFYYIAYSQIGQPAAALAWYNYVISFGPH